MKKLNLSGYRPGKPGLEKVLGSLESEIMEIIWRKDEPVTVRDLVDELKDSRDPAYTTVMTIMGRLSSKKLLLKEKKGNTHLFSPALSRREFTSQVVEGMIDDLLTDFSDTAVSHFIHRAGKQDRSMLEKLEQAIIEAKENRDDDNR